MAYEFTKEIFEAGVVNVVPSYASLNESYFYLQEATENDWNRMMQDIGVLELGILESTGSDVVYEAGENSEVAEEKSNKLVEFVKSAWERIKGAFDTLLQRISAAVKQARDKFNEKFGNKLYQNISNRLSGETDGKETSYGEIYDYGTWGSKKGELAHDMTVNAEFFSRKAEDLIGSMRGEKINITRAWLLEGENLQSLINCATDIKFSKKSIVSSYTSSKKYCDGLLKDAKQSKDKEKISEIKEKITGLNKFASTAVKAFMERQRAALGIVTKLAVKTAGKSAEEKKEAKDQKAAEKSMLKDVSDKTKADKKAAKEAEKAAKQEPVAASYTDPNGTPVLESYSTEVEKLFDWNF